MARREPKAELRRRAAAARDALDPTARGAADRVVRERLFSLPEWARAHTVFVYVSFRSEVDTMGILAEALASGRRVLVPRVDRDRHEIEASEIESLAGLVPGTWGILEPKDPGARAARPTEIDLVAVPGLAFDARGGRLGYGAGYYDRYLPHTRPDCTRAALAYEAQLVAHVPCRRGDQRMHLVVTEERVVRSEWSAQ